LWRCNARRLREQRRGAAKHDRHACHGSDLTGESFESQALTGYFATARVDPDA
jgi:hypothetical protein